MANVSTTSSPHQPESMLRLPQVLERFPVRRSHWYAGIQTGKYPAPVKLGPRIALWRSADIDALIKSLA